MAKERAPLGRINESIADLHAALSTPVPIVDGIVGMEGNGSDSGHAEARGGAGGRSDRVAVDATCCRIMRIETVQGRLPAPGVRRRSVHHGAEYRQIGESLSAVATPFALIPEFQSFRMEQLDASAVEARMGKPGTAGSCALAPDTGGRRAAAGHAVDVVVADPRLG